MSEAAASALRAPKSRTAFRTISEVADDLDVAQHVLRFWESKFPQVRPLKRGGGRRYYRPEDVDVLRQIRSLLYDEGYTIRGAQKLLRLHRGRSAEPSPPDGRPSAGATPADAGVRAPAGRDDLQRRLSDLHEELSELRELLLRAAR